MAELGCKPRQPPSSILSVVLKLGCASESPGGGVCLFTRSGAGVGRAGKGWEGDKGHSNSQLQCKLIMGTVGPL